MRNKYERVRLDSGKTIRLRVVEDNTHTLVGIEVDVYGDEVAGRGFDERKHIIFKGAITRRTPLEFDNTYAMLKTKAS
jgi:hypothetical protein